MKNGEKFGVDGVAGKGKAATEKGKRTSHRTRIGMDFDPKNSKLRNQEKDKYLANYGFRLNSGIQIEFCPHGVDISLAPPNDGVYMHPQVPTLGLRLPMTTFVRGVVTLYRVAPSFVGGGLACGTRLRGPLRLVRYQDVSA